MRRGDTDRRMTEDSRLLASLDQAESAFMIFHNAMV